MSKAIVGATGTHASGKGTLVDYLVAKGFKHFSAREFLKIELVQRDLPVDRNSLNLVATDLRTRFGPEYVAFSLYELAHAEPGNSVIESIYTVAEIEKIRNAAQAAGERFYLVATDADQKIRYGRAMERKSETDRITFEQFVEQESREMSSDDPRKQNLLACRNLASTVIFNNGTIPEFHAQLDAKLHALFA